MRIAPDTLKAKVLAGLFWKFAERVGIQGIQFVIQIILARLLFPRDYAIVALIGVILFISDVLITSGFSTSLVQKQDVDDGDFSSAFYVCLVSAIGLYGALFVAAPLIADFYEEPLLIGVLRVQALILVFGAFRSVQNAVLTRNMQFQKSFYVGVGGILASGTVGVTLACLGYGVWALVYSQLASAAASTAILWVTVSWRPTLVFSLKKVGSLFAFGWKILCACLLEAVYNSLRTLVIGKMFDKDVLGFYNRGESIPQLAATSIDGTISSVMFPALSACQDDRMRLRALLRRTLVTSCFVVFPSMIGLATVSEGVVRILLTDKWLGCVTFMQICCLGYTLFPLHTSNLQAINAMGRSDIFLQLDIIKKTIGVGILLASLPFGVYAVVGSGVLFSVICTFINAWPNKKLLDYSPWQQWADVLPSLLLALVMGAGAWSVTLLSWNVWATLGGQLLVGLTIYLGGAWLLRLECLSYLVRTLKGEGL